jgi:ATP-dependent helicase/nuclease subunit A
MPEINWTSEQRAAIETVSGDVLVTAAAGAGKTAVLTRRCIHLLTNIDPPCSIDELLVLTYTEAAAAEMRRRIRSALYELAAIPTAGGSHRPYQRAGSASDRAHEVDSPGAMHTSSWACKNSTLTSRPMTAPPRLRRQLALLDQARISTIHSFCNALLREYFYRLNLDPGFEILDAAEADLLKLQIADELFEEYYARSQEKDSSDDFAGFVRSYSTGAGDRQLIDLLIRLHNFLETLSDHTAWTEHARRILQTPDPADPQNLFVVQRQKELLKRQLHNLIRRLEYAKTDISRDPRLEFYIQYLDRDVFPILKDIHNALDEDNFNHALQILTENETLKRIPNKPRDLTSDQVEPAKNLIDKAKDVYKTINRKFALPAETVMRQLNSLAPSIHLLLALQQNFLLRYNDAKRRQNVLDFADLEHLALKLLQDNGKPTDVALQMRDRYRFILVDEYQDISPIQEALLQTISRGHDVNTTAQKDGPRLGNLFMVGDVKQSIYSFRQADPTIFLAKFNQFTPCRPGADESSPKLPAQARIDLNKNFRSRRYLINSINYIFSRCMTPEFIGFDYQRQAQLIYGAEFYDQMPSTSDPEVPPAVEFHLIERDLENTEKENDQTEDADLMDDRIELDATRREAVVVARRIRQIVGADRPDGNAEFNIVDPDDKQLRPVAYRDIVILLRSMKMRAEIWSEVFQQLNVPAHAELTGGFFVAAEIQDMLSLLQLLENPQQDIPLAAVLRSPFVRLNESQLAAVRLHSPKQSYCQAVFRYAHAGPDDNIRYILSTFLNRLDLWRTHARREPLAQLIWQIYRDANLLAYVSSLPQGRQRYRNLLHLHDRARQFDTFANQGLARFLAFIEKLREEEGDFGPAPVLSQADDVVRIMSVHKSKGLEFPVVILADLAHKFNKNDLKSDIIYNHNPISPIGLRLSASAAADRYPTITHHLVAADKERALLAEELRILYVALTRARERLLLVAGAGLAKCRNNWHLGKKCGTNPNSLPDLDARIQDATSPDISVDPLPEFVLSAAQAPLDWLGAALAGHPDLQEFLAGADYDTGRTVSGYPMDSRFRVITYDAEEAARLTCQVRRGRELSGVSKELQDLISGGIIGGSKLKEDMGPLAAEAKGAIERLEWRYPQEALTLLGARTSATELKRHLNPDYDPDFSPDGNQLTETYNLRPKFLSEQPARASAVEIGTWTHLFLQHVALDHIPDLPALNSQLDALVVKGMFSPRQRQAIDVNGVARFFVSELGREMLTHRETVEREWPFTLVLPIGQVYPNVELNEIEKEETVLIRGIIDCLFEMEDGIRIIDFKTDDVDESECAARAESYRVQMQLYKKAVEGILKEKAAASTLYFLRPGIAVEVS